MGSLLFSASDTASCGRPAQVHGWLSPLLHFCVVEMLVSCLARARQFLCRLGHKKSSPAAGRGQLKSAGKRVDDDEEIRCCVAVAKGHCHSKTVGV